VPVLRDALKDPSEEVRIAAAAALGEIGPGAKAAVTALSESLRDEAAFVRQRAAEALGHIGAGANPALASLRCALKDKEGAVRVQGALAMWRIDRNSHAISALIDELQAKEGYVRDHAAKALGQIGPAAKKAVPALRKLVKDRDLFSHRIAAEALGK